jgi:hypothetical protein
MVEDSGHHCLDPLQFGNDGVNTYVSSDVAVYDRSAVGVGGSVSGRNDRRAVRAQVWWRRYRVNSSHQNNCQQAR